MTAAEKFEVKQVHALHDRYSGQMFDEKICGVEIVLDRLNFDVSGVDSLLNPQVRYVYVPQLS